MSITKKVGAKIREIRREKGFSQETLANLAGLDRTYITSVENGKRNISIVNLEKISNALRVDLKTLFTFK